MTKTTLILCPDYPPNYSGLSGHTAEFAQELSQHGAVAVLTSEAKAPCLFVPEEIEANPIVYREVKVWGFFHLLGKMKRIREMAPDIIVVQYLPFLYNPRGGINFGICFFLLYLRLRGFKVEVICHELFYPALMQPKAMLMFACHIAMLFLVGIAANKIFASTMRFESETKHILFWKKNIYHLPVGSNMRRIPCTEQEITSFRDELGLAGKFVIIHFGTIHPTRNLNLVAQSIQTWMRAGKINAQIVFIGESEDRLQAAIGAKLWNELSPHITVLGKIDDKKFAAAMHVADASIEYFTDGASTRRGSLLAPLAYGVPTISSRGPDSEEIFLSIENLHLLPAEPDKFLEGIPRCLDEIRNRGGKQTRNPGKNFEKYFSWPSIVKKFRSHSAAAVSIVLASGVMGGGG